MQQLEIGTNEAGQRLDKYLKKLLPQAESSFIYKMLRKKKYCTKRPKNAGQRASGAWRPDYLIFFRRDICQIQRAPAIFNSTACRA